MIFDVQHRRTKTGYSFATRLVSLVKIKDEYTMQLRLFPMNGVWTFYRASNKPRFRNLPVIQVLLIPCLLFFYALIPILFIALYFYYYFVGIWIVVIERPNHFELYEKISSVIWFALGVIGLFYLFNL